MSSQIEELLPLEVGKGCHMRSFINHSDVTYDGADSSDVLAIPNHWHRDHDEIMEVLEGGMIFYLDFKEIVLSAGDEPLLIPRGRVHGFTVIKNQPVRFTERTQPSGTFKARFFQDMFQGGNGEMPGFLFLMRVFYDGDTIPSLPGGWKGLDWLFITVVGFLAKWFAAAKPVELKKKVE